MNRIDGIRIRALVAASTVDRGYRLGKQMCICCFSAKHASLRSKTYDWLTWIQDTVSE